MIDKACKTCGTRLSYFLETGMLGCPDCYKAFESEIKALLKKVQGASQHMGKVPKLNNNDRVLIDKYYKLVEEKEKAVKNGQIENLIELNKDINTLIEVLKERGML